MPNGDRPGSIYEQERPSLLEALGEILEPTYEIPGLSSYTKAIGKASDILDAPITKRKEEFAKTAGIDVEDVSRADVGAGVPLSLMLGGAMGPMGGSLSAAARAMGDPRVTLGDLPAILAPASGDPETGLYSPLDAAFAVAEIVPLAKLATRPIKRIAGKVLDDFSEVVKHVKIRKMKKQMARLEADAPGTLATGQEPMIPAPESAPSLTPEAQEAFADLAETSQASLVPDIADAPTPGISIDDIADVPQTAAIPDAPSPVQALPEGKVMKTSPGGTEYVSLGDEFDDIEKVVVKALEDKGAAIHGFHVVEDTKNFKLADIPDNEVAIIRVRRSEGRTPLRYRDRDVVVYKEKTRAYEGLGETHNSYMMRTVAPEGELLAEARDLGMARLDWSVKTDHATGVNTIDNISFFGKSPDEAVGIEAKEQIQDKIQALVEAGKVSQSRANLMFMDEVRKLGESRLKTFSGMASDDFIKFLPDNWEIKEGSLTFDSFMLLLNTAVKYRARIIFDPGNLQYIKGGTRTVWSEKAGTVLLDQHGEVSREGIDMVINEAKKILARHKHPERIISADPQNIFRHVADPEKLEKTSALFGRARLDPRLRRKLEQQHGVERANEIMEQVEKGYESYSIRGGQAVEIGSMTIKQVKSVVAGLMGLSGVKEFEKFMNYNPESMEAQVFDNEQMF